MTQSISESISEQAAPNLSRPPAGCGDSGLDLWAGSLPFQRIIPRYTEIFSLIEADRSFRAVGSRRHRVPLPALAVASLSAPLGCRHLQELRPA